MSTGKEMWRFFNGMRKAFSCLTDFLLSQYTFQPNFDNVVVFQPFITSITLQNKPELFHSIV